MVVAALAEWDGYEDFIEGDAHLRERDHAPQGLFSNFRILFCAAYTLKGYDEMCPQEFLSNSDVGHGTPYMSTRGIWKEHHYWQTAEARKDWADFATKYPTIAAQFAPGPDAGWRSIDRQLTRARAALESPSVSRRLVSNADDQGDG